jgi:hypothetical protein
MYFKPNFKLLLAYKYFIYFLFLTNTSLLRRSINIRLHSIQQLYFLSLSVKIQFLKTFILPFFDYCASLCIYFPKLVIQKLANTYNNCIFSLIATKQIKNFIIEDSSDFNKWNTLLENYGLNAFQHRLIIRISTYIHKILNIENSPKNLKNTFTTNEELNKHYDLRNLQDLTIPSIGIFNDHGKETFEYFFSQFINKTLKDLTDYNPRFFKTVIEKNINSLFLKQIENFDKFDLRFRIYYKPFKKLIKKKKNNLFLL